MKRLLVGRSVFDHHIEPDKRFSLYVLYGCFVEVERDAGTARIIGKGAV